MLSAFKGTKGPIQLCSSILKIVSGCLLSIKTSPGFLGYHVRLFASGPNTGLILAVTPALCSPATPHTGLQAAANTKKSQVWGLCAQHGLHLPYGSCLLPGSDHQDKLHSPRMRSSTASSKILLIDCLCTPFPGGADHSLFCADSFFSPVILCPFYLYLSTSSLRGRDNVPLPSQLQHRTELCQVGGGQSRLFSMNG